jgi:serine/threonine-protein kinase
MLTGKWPFSATTPSALAMQIMRAPAPAPSALNRALPADIDPIVSAALAKSLDLRYESAATMAAELRAVGAILDVRNEAHEPAAASVVVHTRRRSHVGWVVAVVLAALAAAAWLTLG